MCASMPRHNFHAHFMSSNSSKYTAAYKICSTYTAALVALWSQQAFASAFWRMESDIHGSTCKRSASMHIFCRQKSTYTAASVACEFFSCGPVSSQFVPRIVLIDYAMAQNTRQQALQAHTFARHADCRRRQSDFLACTRFHAHIFMQ